VKRENAVSMSIDQTERLVAGIQFINTYAAGLFLLGFVSSNFCLLTVTGVRVSGASRSHLRIVLH
jgi:hypothetical protein